jgi:hypothetical protein
MQIRRERVFLCQRMLIRSLRWLGLRKEWDLWKRVLENLLGNLIIEIPSWWLNSKSPLRDIHEWIFSHYQCALVESHLWWSASFSNSDLVVDFFDKAEAEWFLEEDAKTVQKMGLDLQTFESLRNKSFLEKGLIIHSLLLEYIPCLFWGRLSQYVNSIVCLFHPKPQSNFWWNSRRGQHRLWYDVGTQPIGALI